MSPTYEIRRFDRIEAWFVANTDDVSACAAMKRWVIELMRSPRQVCNGRVEQARTGRVMFYAVVPGTGAMVTYLVGDNPVRIVTIVSVIPAP